MFNLNKIKKLEKEINDLRNQNIEFIKHANQILHDVLSQSKQKYMWELRQEEVDLIDDGHKYRKIRKILS
jgi:3',5'-cyclic AMP phosphodiesterase CpdA